MSRLIDADALRANFPEPKDWRDPEQALMHITGIWAEIDNAPTIEPEIVRCHKCIYWNRDTVRQNSNDAGWWNEAVCKRYSDEIWTSWKDADWYCADAERRTDDQSK